MRKLALLVVGLILVGCGGSTTATPAPLVTETQVATATPLPPTATTAPTSTSTATATSAPTSIPTSTATAVPTSTSTSTPTMTATTAPVDASAWRLHVVTAGLTVAAIEELDRLAEQRQAGTLEGIDLSGRLIGVGLVLRATDDALAEYSAGGRPAAYTAPLREHIAGTAVVIARWLNGDTTSATVAGELQPVQAASEQTLGEILGELRGLGVSQAQLETFLAEIGGMFDVE